MTEGTIVVAYQQSSKHRFGFKNMSTNLFIRGKAKNCIFGNGQLKFIMLALRIDFSVPPRRDHRGFCTEFYKLCTVCTA